MVRKLKFILPILLLVPAFVWAAAGNDIEAATKFKTLLLAGSRILGGIICLIAVLSNGFKQALKSIMDEERSSSENKNLITRFGMLAAGLIMVFFAESIYDFLISFM